MFKLILNSITNIVQADKNLVNRSIVCSIRGIYFLRCDKNAHLYMHE